MERVPVMCGLRCIELADASMAEKLAHAPNARAIRRRRDGVLVEIQMRAAGDDSTRRPCKADPRRYSHNHETAQNPRGVWTLRWISPDVRGVFTTVLDECFR